LIMYFVYILYSHKLDKYYIGYSSDIESRLKKHNSISKGFTNLGKPWILMYSEVYNSKKEAMTREKQLKNWKNRHKIETLIKVGSLPTTRNLISEAYRSQQGHSGPSIRFIFEQL